MMKIALMSGAVKNAGDYLITRRSRELLTHFYPDAAIETFIRNIALTEEQIESINEKDLMIFAGGPCYKENLHPRVIPLTADLDLLKPKMAIVGSGWYGSSTLPSDVWNYRFGEGTMRLLSRIAADTSTLGCRDFYSVRVLKANGLDGSLMTGCPAWYELDRLGKRLDRTAEPHVIAVSEPANLGNYAGQCMKLVMYLKKRYPEAEIRFIFHRGTGDKGFTDSRSAENAAKFKRALDEMGVSTFDISYGDEGFRIYDDCDLHIGYRVHAHIYNLSMRQASILIEEDSRGAGVNEALGLWGIRAYAKKRASATTVAAKAMGKVFWRIPRNSACLNDVEAYLDYIFDTDGQIFDMAFSRMEAFFEAMSGHITSLEKYI